MAAGVAALHFVHHPLARRNAGHALLEDPRHHRPTSHTGVDRSAVVMNGINENASCER